MILSIIVPVFNMASDEKLNHCLDSLVNQTLSDYEIIAVDDCSTDDSFKIMKEYEKNYPGKFRAIHSEVNLHQGGAKNIGIRAAKGDWIGFIDADDWITPDMYEKLIKRAEETGADCVGCDYTLVNSYTFEPGETVYNSQMSQVGVLSDNERRSLILDSGSLVVKIYRRQMVVENELYFPENIFYEDNAMSNSYLLLNKHYEYIREPMYFYLQHETSTVHTITERRCLDRMEAGYRLIEEAKKFGFLEKFKPEIEYQFTLLFYVNTLFSYMPGIKRPRVSFVKKLGDEMREYFPEFQTNPYYLERTNAEEKKLIKMQQKNSLIFMLYYKALWSYRGVMKRLRSGK